MKNERLVRIIKNYRRKCVTVLLAMNLLFIVVYWYLTKADLSRDFEHAVNAANSYFILIVVAVGLHVVLALSISFMEKITFEILLSDRGDDK